MDSASSALRAARRSRWIGGGLEATRQSLLTRLKDHADHDGWQRFFDTYGGVIHALAIRAGLTASEADEALQETLVSVASEMPGFRYNSLKGTFKGWLFRIARRRVVDQFRKRERRERHLGRDARDLEELPDPAADALTQAWEEEWQRNHLELAVERVKERVSPAQWQMFDLAAVQQWPTERICAFLGVNRAQVYMAKMRVGRLFRVEFEKLKNSC